MENLPWPAITAAGGGWALFGWLAWTVLRKLMSGDLVTRREIDAKDHEILRRREENDHLREQLGVAIRTLSESNDIANAVRAVAEEKT